MIRHHDDLVRSLQQVRDGRLSRRAFLGAAAAAGFSAAMADRLLTTSAAAAPARQDEPPQGGQVIVGLSQEPTIFNPMNSFLEVDRGVQFSIFDSLWRIDVGASCPNLATEIPSLENGGISEDGLTYTFSRQDAVFHDGEPFTAADVHFTATTIMSADFVPGTSSGTTRSPNLRPGRLHGNLDPGKRSRPS